LHCITNKPPPVFLPILPKQLSISPLSHRSSNKNKLKQSIHSPNLQKQQVVATKLPHTLDNPDYSILQYCHDHSNDFANIFRQKISNGSI
jgi:hypothetical protein